MYESVPVHFEIAVYLGIAAFGMVAIALNAWLWTSARPAGRE